MLRYFIGQPDRTVHEIGSGSALKRLAYENFLELQDLLAGQFGAESLLDCGEQCFRFLYGELNLEPNSSHFVSPC